jgi:hypothetical protein
MERRGSAFDGFAIEASDGFVGRISDLLFDDKTWTVRWFVVDINTWESVRQILVHPSALETPDNLNRAFEVKLTKIQVETSPSIYSDEPVSRQMEPDVSDGYGYSPTWGGGYYGGSSLDTRDGWLNNNGVISHGTKENTDPHLRSNCAVKGYHIQAIDGEVGHLLDFMMDDETWQIECALIDTKNWWRGKNVLLPVAAITQINWAGEFIKVDQTRYKIKACPAWTKPDWSNTTDGP